MKKKNFLYLFLLSPLFFLFSCDGETLELTLEVPDGPSKFQPLVVGNYIDYQIDTVRFTEFDGYDSGTYQLRELIAEQLDDSFSNQRYKLERYRRADETQNWRLDSIWTARFQNSSYIKIENNVPFVRLVSPVLANTTWNGNLLNSNSEETYRVGFYLEDYTVLDKTYNNSMEIIHQVDTSLLFTNTRSEIFAEGVGLIYKKAESIRLCDLSGCFGTKLPVGGTSFEQKIIGTGKM
jgi:hypothetical protein